jgi:MFS family permease
LFYKENGLSDGDFFLFKAIFSFVGLLFEIPSGYIADIFPKKNVLILSFALLLSQTLLWLCFQGYLIILIGEILVSISRSFYSVASHSYLYEYLKANNKSEKMLQRYGNMNFYLSLGSALTSLLGATFYNVVGVKFLLSIDLVLMSGAIVLLLFLPQVAVSYKRINGLGHFNIVKEKYIELLTVVRMTMRNKKINSYLWFSGVLGAFTLVFAFCFQTVMKVSATPVPVFGIVYFVNHIIRALTGMLLPKISKKLSLEKTGFFAYILFCLSFVLLILAYYIKNFVVTLIFLLIVCAIIGVQLAYLLLVNVYVHAKTLARVRATVLSVGSMILRGSAAIILFFFKLFLNNYTLDIPLFVFGVLFFLTFFTFRKKLFVQQV